MSRSAAVTDGRLETVVRSLERARIIGGAIVFGTSGSDGRGIGGIALELRVDEGMSRIALNGAAAGDRFIEGQPERAECRNGHRLGRSGPAPATCKRGCRRRVRCREPYAFGGTRDAEISRASRCSLDAIRISAGLISR